MLAMNIIVGTEVAESLKVNYTVLELETFTVKDRQVTTYCVVNEIPITELPSLERNKELHAEFINQYTAGNFNNCAVIAEGLRGKFNGELDSFYDVILDKINNTIK